MQLDLWLKDRFRWLLNPSTFVNLAVALMAVAWSSQTLRLERG